MNKTANQEIRIYKSDGSDGYLTGTYGCVVTTHYPNGSTGCTSDGGYSTEVEAKEWADKWALAHG
jgi:hypothetical protein